MMTHLTERQIWSYLEGELAELELERMEAHFEQCDLCSERLAVLAEIGADVPDLFPLEAPSAGFADRVMAEIETRQESVIVPLKAARTSPRLEFFTRFATAAVVTGFMLFGSVHAQGLPVIGSFGNAISETGNVVSDGTFELYAKINGWIALMNQAITK